MLTERIGGSRHYYEEVGQINAYRDLLRMRGARSLLLLSLVVRGINIPIGAIITVVAYEISGSWGEAALAGGIAAGASALAMWVSGQMMDIWSPRKVLLLFIPGGLVSLLFLQEPQGWALLGAAFLLGITRPPSGTTVRTSWQRVVSDENKRLLAYGLDAALTPIAGALGALLSGILVATLGWQSLVWFLTAAATISTILLALHPATSGDGARRGFALSDLMPGRNLPPLGRAIWITIGMVALSWGALVGLEILVGDRFGPEMLLLVTALGGIAVALGALGNNKAKDRSGKSSLVFSSLLASLSLLLVTLAFWTEPLLAFPAIISFGVARGIISASGSAFLSIASPPERRSETLALYGSGVLLGQAIYRPLSGALLFAAPVLILLLPAALFLWLGSRLQKGSSA